MVKEILTSKSHIPALKVIMGATVAMMVDSELEDFAQSEIELGVVYPLQSGTQRNILICWT